MKINCDERAEIESIQEDKKVEDEILNRNISKEQLTF